MKEKLFQQLAAIINKADTILLVGHAHPDQDTIGSVLAWQLYLSRLGKKVVGYLPEAIPDYATFLPTSENLTFDAGVFNSRWDLIIFLDCSDLSRADLTSEKILGNLTVALDHHVSNLNFADFNIVDVHASSTCEIVYQYFSALNYPLDKNIATCLLAGILSDTGGFSNAATTSTSILIASDLVKKGAKIYQIINYVMRNKSLAGLKLWGLALSRLTINKELNIAYTYITDEDFYRFKIKEEEIDGLSNFLNVIVEVAAVAVFRLYPDKLKASWRTKRDDIDLNKLCKLFGGGGHQKAAGFVINYQVIEKEGNLVVL